MSNYYQFYFQVSNEKFNINTNQLEEVISEQREESMVLNQLCNAQMKKLEDSQLKIEVYTAQFPMLCN